MSLRHRHPLPFGATYHLGGRTRFRFHAPAQKTPMLAIDGRLPEPLQPEGDGWFSLETTCSAGTSYRYRLDDGTLVPDPASRAQAEDIHGPSVVVDPEEFEWLETSWKGHPWEHTVLYEAHAGACGGFAGLASRLPALAALGITAVELMPIADFPGAHNWGYDGVLPYAPDARYGTPAQLKSLIDHAHGLGLSVFLDVVYNHFGPDGNYLHAYAPTFFREDVHTPWGSAIDFRRPEVREYFIQNALYWLMEYRFDGLRFDAVHAIGDPTFLDELARTVRAAVEPGRFVHLVLENEHNEADHLVRGDGGSALLFDAQWNDDFHNTVHVLLTGEREGYYLNYAEAPAMKLARALSEGFVYQGEPSPGHDGSPRGTPSRHLPPTAFVSFLQNHDQIGNRAFGERLTSLVDADALHAAAALHILSPAIPLLFMGEEWGSRSPFLFFTDHNAELAPKVREGRRKEFARFASFRDPAMRERIPDPNDPETFFRSIPVLAETLQGEHADWYAYYRRLLHTRRDLLLPFLAGASSLGATTLGESGAIGRWRLRGGMTWTLVVNLSGAHPPIDPPRGRLVFESRPDLGTAIQHGQMPARCACVYSGDGA